LKLKRNEIPHTALLAGAPPAPARMAREAQKKRQENIHRGLYFFKKALDRESDK
jgi:hypothetical protein